MELRALTDVRVAPDDRAVDDRADIDGYVVAEDRWANDLDVRSDLHSLAEIDRTGEPRGLVDIHLAGGPHARQELVAERLTLHFAAQQIGVRARVFADRSDVRPVPVGDVSKEGFALSEQPREEILAEVEHLASGETLEYARL